MAATVEAVVACERLAIRLAELAAWLDQAASMARADWAGPHRDTFDVRVAGIGRALLDAADTLNVLRLRVESQPGHP
jgi:hypothetical protein